MTGDSTPLLMSILQGAHASLSVLHLSLGCASLCLHQEADAICCSDPVDKHMHAAQHAFLAGIAVHMALYTELSPHIWSRTVEINGVGKGLLNIAINQPHLESSACSGQCCKRTQLCF